jgi:hypothetical protein
MAIPQSAIIYALSKLFKEDFVQRIGRAAGTRHQLIF